MRLHFFASSSLVRTAKSPQQCGLFCATDLNRASSPPLRSVDYCTTAILLALRARLLLSAIFESSPHRKKSTAMWTFLCDGLIGAPANFIYFSILYSISIGCNACTPVPSLICVRHDVPGAAINTGRSTLWFFTASRTAGNKIISPIANDVR